MARVITREKVKGLTRGLPEKVSEQEYNKIKKIPLIVYENKAVRWGRSKGLIEKGFVEIDTGIRMSFMYEEGLREGVHKKKKYGFLDEYLYYEINNNEELLNLKGVRDFERKNKTRMSRELRYFSKWIETDYSNKAKKRLVIATKGLKSFNKGSSKVKDEFKGIDGYKMEEMFVNELNREYKHTIKKNSDKDQMVVWLEEKDYVLWEGFLYIIEEYNRFMHK